MTDAGDLGSIHSLNRLPFAVCSSCSLSCGSLHPAPPQFGPDGTLSILTRWSDDHRRRLEGVGCVGVHSLKAINAQAETWQIGTLGLGQ